MQEATLFIDPGRVVGPIDPRLYSNFTEHMGRLIYGGLWDPTSKFSDPNTGFRQDVIDELKAIKTPLVRYPGGNFVATYRWQDGIGPRDKRPKRPELAWRGVETNQFGTDEFMQWCDKVGCLPFICLNMGTGTLESALDWIEYMCGDGDTYWANERRKNNPNHPQPYNVPIIALGNEIWGPWQIMQQSAEDYAKAARQWAKAIKLLVPHVKLVLCGKEGNDDWDRIVLNETIDIVDYHSLHWYSRGPSHEACVFSPHGAEVGIRSTMQIIELARIKKKTANKPLICFDEWNVWDPDLAPGDKGAEQTYNMSDALAVATWLNIFMRNCNDVAIACIAQAVNVIAPLTTHPTDPDKGLLRQATWPVFKLYADFMRGKSLDVYVDSPKWTGDAEFLGMTMDAYNDRTWLPTIARDRFTWIDSTAALDEESSVLNLAIVNRHPTESFAVRLGLSNFGRTEFVFSGDVEVYEIHHEDLHATNTWDNPDNVKAILRNEIFAHTVQMKAGSFKLLRLKYKR